MTVLHSLLLAATSPTTTASSSKSSGSSYGILIIAVIGLAFYFLILRPRSQRQRASRAQSSTLDVGDAVMSVGGIKGIVVDIDGTDVHVEVSPGVVLTFIRRAVNADPAVPKVIEDEDEPAGVLHEHEGTDDDFAAFDDRGVDESGHGRAVDEEHRPAATSGPDEPDERPGTGIEGR